jgi:hypothetical protein
MLTLAGLHRRDRQESHHSILAELLGPHTARQQEEQEMLLWQSRLILQLGEMYDRQQRDLNGALVRISSQQEALLAELRDEEDNPFALTTSLRDGRQETDGILLHRLKAWARICLHAPSQPQGLLVTRHQAAIDLLIETYERVCDHSPCLAGTLELPAWMDVAEEEGSTSELLVDQCPGIHTALEKITRALQGGDAGDPTLNLLLKEHASQWALCLEARYPKANYGRSQLAIYVFPEMSARNVLRKGLIGDLAPDAGDRLPPGGCCIGLLKTGENT